MREEERGVSYFPIPNTYVAQSPTLSELCAYSLFGSSDGLCMIRTFLFLLKQYVGYYAIMCKVQSMI
jgi:hypothetical protein